MKAQLSIELLLAGAVLAAAALLAANYASATGQSTGQSSKFVQAELVAAQVARIANAACVSKTQVSFELECPSSGFVDIGSGAAFTVSAGGGTARARTACPLAEALSFPCGEAGRRWICFSSIDGGVSLSEGRCA